MIGRHGRVPRTLDEFKSYLDDRSSANRGHALPGRSNCPCGRRGYGQLPCVTQNGSTGQSSIERLRRRRTAGRCRCRCPRRTLGGMGNVVEVANLRKTFGSSIAVDVACLTVERGTVLGVLGPNGAGKTTLVECVAGLHRPDGGSVRVLGLDPATDPEAV